MAEREMQISEMKLLKATVKLVGVTPLLTARRSPVPPKGEIVDNSPQAQFERAIYWLNGDHSQLGFPAGGIKGCMVSACRYIPGINMVYIKGAVQVAGGILPLNADYPTLHSSVGENPNAKGHVAINIHRPMYWPWSIDKAEVLFNEALVPVDDIARILNVGGVHVGLGAWRPENNGSFGMFVLGSMEIDTVDRFEFGGNNKGE